MKHRPEGRHERRRVTRDLGYGLRRPVALAIALAAIMMTRQSSAAGAAVEAGDLPIRTRADLRAEIAKARVVSPDLFKTVADIAARAKEFDARSRTPGAPLTLHFKALGNRALYPMLDVLVFDSHSRDLTPSAASALDWLRSGWRSLRRPLKRDWIAMCGKCSAPNALFWHWSAARKSTPASWRTLPGHP